MKKSNEFGKLLLFDCKDCSGNINDKKTIQKFIDDVVFAMNMEKIGETHFEWFDFTPKNIELNLVGYSVSQIISMSSITIHICSLSKEVFIDIFTCCKINEEMLNKISNIVNWTFSPYNINKQVINRN